jgi:hypothetical protein
MSAVRKPAAAQIDEEDTQAPHKRPIYHVTKLEKCKLDRNGPSGYRYVIEGGYAPITGFRAGTKDHVQSHAAMLAKEMNNRRGVKGTKHIVIGKPKTA